MNGMVNALMISFTIFGIMGVYAFLNRNEIKETEERLERELAKLCSDLGAKPNRPEAQK